MTLEVQTARAQALGDLPRRSALRCGSKTALIDGDARLTFAELDAVVDRTVAGLQDLGLRKGDRIALLSHNCWQFVALSYATARAGLVLVPINFMLGADEIAFIIDHSEAVAFVAEDALTATADAAIDSATADVAHRISIGLNGQVPAGWRALEELLDFDSAAPTPVVVADDDPIRLMYTSGTESRPKGVLLSSRSLMWQYVSVIVDGSMTSDDVEVHALPFYHCAQLDAFLNVDVYLGATSIVLRGPDPAALLATIERESVTKLFCPPTVWISLLRSPAFDTTDLSSLRKGYYGASPMPVEILHEMSQRMPGVRLWNFYGQTEMSPVVTILGPDEQLPKAGSAGRAALNVEVRIADDQDNPLPVGEVGEIVSRSPHATLGYYRDPEKTAEAFRNGWFHSGDLGVLDEDGYVTVVDRKKDMIKTGGENVASREVEEAIYELEGVAEVAVFAISHPTWIEAVAAVVVPKTGVALTEQDVIDFARGRLAGYKAPKYVAITSALPKNPSGKIVKRTLREEFADLAER